MHDAVHIVCPHCDSVNRLPSDKPPDAAKCGKCHHALFERQSVRLAAGNFAHHIGRGDIPVLVDFWAPWCAPCKMMAPVFEQAAAQLEPHVRCAKLDTESAPDVARSLDIRSIPTLILFREGREHMRTAGAMDLANLLAWVRRSL